MTYASVLPVFHADQRVIAEGIAYAKDEPHYGGGPGVVTMIQPQGGGDYWIWVLLDGATAAVPYQARQLREEPPV
jgi:hypothetical protein